MNEEQIKVKETIISQLSEDEVNNQYLIDQIETISNPEQSDFFYSKLIDLFVHLSIDEEEAQQHLKKILKHYYEICKKLNRDVGLRLAMFDYFINLNKSLESPLLVEIRLFREAEQFAMYDFLTGLFNRRYFDTCLSKELRRAARYNKDFSILLLDLDDFKKLNDTHGHLLGDEVLKKFAALLKHMSRAEDIVCRYGGEEFVILLPETVAGGALSYAERIKATMKNDAFFQQYKLTFSGGIATYQYGGSSALQLIANADDALYNAKQAGKNQAHISKVENRKLFRFPKTWQIYLQPLGHQKKDTSPTPCLSQNISLEGLSVETKENYVVGERVFIKIELPAEDKIAVVGEFIWSNKNNDAVNTYGIRFVDLTSEQLKYLEQMLSLDKLI